MRWERDAHFQPAAPGIRFGCQKIAKKPVFAFTFLHFCAFYFLFYLINH